LIVERDDDKINVQIFYEGFGIFTDFGQTNRVVTEFIICFDYLILRGLN